MTEQTAFGQWLRDNIADQVDTSKCSPDEAAEAVAGWVLARLPDTG